MLPTAVLGRVIYSCQKRCRSRVFAPDSRNRHGDETPTLHVTDRSLITAPRWAGRGGEWQTVQKLSLWIIVIPGILFMMTA
ncbi:MAG: hypothetical protein OHK0012_01870 [Synechococcales cyanobacterium]